MDELQIERILSELPWTKNVFQGVYSSDTLPRKKIKTRPCAMVVNTDQEHEPGSHWSAIFLDDDGTGEYFDSYGIPPLSRHVLDFLNKQTNNNWTFNTRQLQGAYTTLCGGYCIFYIMYKCRYNLSMERIIRMMFPIEHAPPLSNDIKVQKSLKQRFGLFVPLVAMDVVTQQLLRMYKQ